MKVEAAFVLSAADAADLPRDGLAELALIGRSNVGKSSLINAIVRARVARTSAAPGKTRLANIYRVSRGAAAPFYLVDLPGYGYARGGADAARAFDELTRGFFGRERREGLERREGKPHPARPAYPALVSALLLVDARHPGLESDLEAWRWLHSTVDRVAILATKIDKLARGERIRALRELESVFEDSVLPVSAVTGEGLDDLWKLIDRLLNSSSSNPPRRNSSSNPLRRNHSSPRRAATAPSVLAATSRRPRPRRKS